jgi:hypothetical protein
MKKETKTFIGCINGVHLSGLQLIPDSILGKKYQDFDSDEWISYICLLHTKAIKQEKEIKRLEKKLKYFNKVLTKNS